MSVVINGSAGVTTNSGAVYNGIASGTAVASTSGTSIDFTSIPSWVKRITVSFAGVSTNGTGFLYLQLGAGSITTSGYVGSGSSPSNGATAPTSAFAIATSITAATTQSGIIVLTNVSSNTWAEAGTLAFNNASYGNNSGGYVTLGGTLDRIRITTSTGTDTFDAGSINILYE